jgi:hypothetical protein
MYRGRAVNGLYHFVAADDKNFSNITMRREVTLFLSESHLAFSKNVSEGI